MSIQTRKLHRPECLADVRYCLRDMFNKEHKRRRAKVWLVRCIRCDELYYQPVKVGDFLHSEDRYCKDCQKRREHPLGCNCDQCEREAYDAWLKDRIPPTDEEVERSNDWMDAAAAQHLRATNRERRMQKHSKKPVKVLEISLKNIL